jgi:hypothetical protein
MSTEQFPLTLAAVKKGENNTWLIGDALLDECGPPQERVRNDKIKIAAQFLAEQGFDYSAGHLCHLRSTSYAFTAVARIRSIRWDAHYVARDPKTLNMIISKTPKNQKITKRYIVKFLKAWHESELSKQRKKEADCLAAFEKAKREEASSDELDKLQKDLINAATPPKRREGTPPEKADVPQMMSELECAVLAGKARSLADEARKILEPIVFDLDYEVRRAFVIEARLVMNVWQSLAEYVERRGSNAVLNFEVIEKVG